MLRSNYWPGRRCPWLASMLVTGKLRAVNTSARCVLLVSMCPSSAEGTGRPDLPAALFPPLREWDVPWQRACLHA